MDFRERRERIYAGWLGKCIGVRLGVPVENWTAAEIERNLGPIERFVPLPPGRVFQPDDDTSVPLVLIRALERHGRDMTPADVGDTLLDLIAEGRGALWWGGYGRSSEHTAYLNLQHGIPAPLSGSAALNGRWLSEQIGGQIFSDVWGLVAPGDPALAADLAARASSVSHDGAGIDGGRFIAALVSTAFGERDPRTLIAAGLRQIPADGIYAAAIGAVCDHHRRDPDDWRGCLARLDRDWGPQRFGGPVHIVPNAGVVALALLYGGGDFDRAVRIAAMAGWDTDCNAGNVGAIMGTAVGLAGIGDHWREPMNDRLVTAGVVGSRNLTDIPRCADLLAELGARLDGETPPAPPRFHWELPGSTHGFAAEGERVGLVALRQVAGADLSGGGALQVTLRGLSKKGEARVSAPTFLWPEQLSANNYGASFSPTIYPGQTLRARLAVPPDAPAGLLAALWAWDDHAGTPHQALATELRPGTEHTLSFTVPPLADALLSRVGLAFRTAGTAWSGRVLISSLDWDGAPRWSCGFRRERAAYDAIGGWTVARGFWRLDDGAYHGSGAAGAASYTGDPAWRDLHVEADLVPLLGAEHYLLLRANGTRRGYAVGLHGSGRLAVLKQHRAAREAASVSCRWTPDERIRLRVTLQDAEMVVEANGARLRWRDEDDAYLAGQIGLGAGAGCHTRWEWIAVEGIDTSPD